MYGGVICRVQRLETDDQLSNGRQKSDLLDLEQSQYRWWSMVLVYNSIR